MRKTIPTSILLILILCLPALAQTPLKLKSMTLAKRPANVELIQLRSEKHDGTWYYYAMLRNNDTQRSVSRSVELRAFQMIGNISLSAGVNAYHLNLGGGATTTSTITWQRERDTNRLRVELWDMEANKKISEQTISLPAESPLSGPSAAQSSQAASQGNLYDPNAKEQVEIVDVTYVGGWAFKITLKNIGAKPVLSNRLEARFRMSRILGDTVVQQSVSVPPITTGQEVSVTSQRRNLEHDCGLYSDIFVEVVSKASGDIMDSGTFDFALPKVDITDIRMVFADSGHKLDIRGIFDNHSDQNVKLLLKLKVDIAKRGDMIEQTLWFNVPVEIEAHDKLTSTLLTDLIKYVSEMIAPHYPGIKGYLVYMSGDLVMPATKECPMEVFLDHHEFGMNTELMQYGYYDDK